MDNCGNSRANTCRQSSDQRVVVRRFARRRRPFGRSAFIRSKPAKRLDRASRARRAPRNRNEYTLKPWSHEDQLEGKSGASSRGNSSSNSVIVPGVSAGRPAGRRIRAVVVGRVRSARASTAARLGAPGLSFRRWRRARSALRKRDRRQNIVRVVVASPLRRGATSVPPSTPSRRVKSPSRRFRARVAGRGPAFASSPPATAFGRTSVTGGGYATSFSVNPGRWSVFGTGGND
ncbi:hypothetical protein V9T40_013441 [Parthenolecanium corni]|uniref:Uncharacterized protein n=1 Tax=Parthenolecanium corni TaxID=536013 RepID=A0AAN9T5G3_9HEMI